MTCEAEACRRGMTSICCVVRSGKRSGQAAEVAAEVAAALAVPVRHIRDAANFFKAVQRAFNSALISFSPVTGLFFCLSVLEEAATSAVPGALCTVPAQRYMPSPNKRSSECRRRQNFSAAAQTPSLRCRNLRKCGQAIPRRLNRLFLARYHRCERPS